MILRRMVLALLALFLVGHRRCPPPDTHLFAVAFSDRVATWEKFETVGLVWPEVPNPFDPGKADLRGEFRRPGGGVVEMPGFLFQDFDRELAGGRERLTPVGRPYWKVRFTPTEPGHWEWRWVATTDTGSAATNWLPLTVDPPAPGRHGFLRVSSADPRYLRFDDGTPYTALGENLSWYDGRGTVAYDDWFSKLAAQGANYVRLWMPSWAFGLEALERDSGGAIRSISLGDYRARLGRAWQLDTVLEAAERHGLYVMLNIQNHGPFSLTANSEWEDNPYNAANGGPLTAPREVFTNSEARELFRRRLRYLVARWGYSPHLLAWELWNEVNLVAPHADPSVVAWHVEMARELRALDPYDHLITTSISTPAPSPLWDLPEIELVQIHFYAYPFELDMAEALGSLVNQFRIPDKPTLVSEFGVDWRGPAETRARDPEAVGFHDGLWGGLLSGCFGTAMTWWWDNVIDPDDLYFHLGAIARLVEGISFDEEAFVVEQPAATAAGRDLAAYALRGPRIVLAWIKNRDHQWFPPGSGLDPTPVSGAELVFEALSDGRWTVRWMDPYSGSVVAVEAVGVAGGGAILAVPSFARDLALRLERQS